MFWKLFDILVRELRLRCPCCGHGRLFKTTFRVHDHCVSCGERFERESGQWFGVIYINLGLTLALAATGFVVTQAFTLYRPRVLGQWFDGIRFYAAASSPTRSRRT